MEQDNRFEFIVDEQYENEKGIFTVLSIHKNEMVIRWEGGEEIRTDIELQRNIQARREWEVLQLEKEALAAAKARKTGGKKAVFEGFKESDFKNSASGTKWRGRAQLGGAVTQKLVESKFNFNSWAFANKPEMHWMDATHQKRQSGDSRAKFFVRVDPDTLIYGFSVGQATGDKDVSKNWDQFIDWLVDMENAEDLHAIALEHQIMVGDKNGSDNKAIVPVKGGWKVGGGKKKHAIEKFAELIQKLPAENEIALELFKKAEKKVVLDSGKNIAIDIAELFSKFIPIYRAALTPVQ